MNTRTRTRAGALAAALTLLPAALAAQQGSAPRLEALAFTDTAFVRIEARLTGAPGGTPVLAVITGRPGEVLWAGALGSAGTPDAKGVGHAERTVTGLHPRLWSPTSPELYTLVVSAGGAADTLRIGFRHVETTDGQVVLNGKPVFLRGNAINPPGRTIPDSLDENRRFVEDYVRYMKSIGVNMIRLSRTSQVWLDVTDELGMLVYQGLYGVPRGGSASKPPAKPFAEVLADYREVFEPLASHPSVVVYVLSNELASHDIVHRSAGADTVEAFLRSVHHALRAWDSTRVYIGNAGYGYGRSGDFCDVHHYYGWYYNTALSMYTLRDPKACWRIGAVQPITISENTGNYTGPDGRFNVIPDKQLSSQLNWTGHAPESEQSRRALAYQAYTAGQTIEIMRRTRAINPYLAGLMPFTTMFSRWWGISRFADMAPKPVADQYALSYQPVLLSWELWTSQVYAGSTLKPTAHVVNDDDLGRDLRGLELAWRIVGPAGVVDSARVGLGDVAYYGAASRQLSLALPASLPEGTYTLEGRLLHGSEVVSRNRTSFFVAPAGYAGAPGKLARRLVLFDPAGRTAPVLQRLGVPFTPLRTLAGLRPATDALILGERAWSAAPAGAPATLGAFLRAGGRVLALAQESGKFDASWTGVRLRMPTEPVDAPGDRRAGAPPFRDAMAVNPERPAHPVWQGVDRDRLFLWSDPTGWTERTPGFPAVYPVTNGFVLAEPADLERVAVLADYGPGLEGIGLAEVFQGKGSALLSGFGMVERAGLDPVAERLLVNLVRYLGSAEAHYAQPLVTKPIAWGDYESENGIALGVYQGLIVNPVPVVPEGLRARYPIRVDSTGFMSAGSRGGWNDRPAIQYVAHGRRAFGPYELTVFSSPKVKDDAPALGAGAFWARVPATTKLAVTTIENPIDEVLPVEVTVNGVTRRATVPAHGKTTVEVPVSEAAVLAPGAPAGGAAGKPVAVRFRADRRLVITETAFR